MLVQKPLVNTATAPGPVRPIATQTLPSRIVEYVLGNSLHRLIRAQHSIVESATEGSVSRLAGLALVGGKLQGFSCERLFKYLNRLGHDVQITLTESPATAGQGRTTLEGAA